MSSSRSIRLGAILCCLLGAGWQGVPAQTIGGTVRIAWDANVADPDLSGYRVYAHTDPSIYALDPNQARLVARTTVVAKGVTTSDVTGLDPNRVWHFAVTSLDLSGNESVFSNVVSQQPNLPPMVRTVTPSAAEQGTSSLSVTVTGDHFVSTSTVDFGSGITVNSVNTTSLTTLVAQITVAPLAQVSARDVTVTNSFAGSATRTGAFLVTIDSSRVDVDCSGRVDNADFIDVLIGFGSVAGDANYSTARDLDVDGQVDGADLAILFSLFGSSGLCP